MKRGKYRHAVFIVLYKREGRNKDKIKYLLLKRHLHWKGWEFSKGKIESGETQLQAAKREAREESGLKILNEVNFHIAGRYLYKKILPDRPGVIGQTFHLFSSEVGAGTVKVDRIEHSGHKWVSFEKALKMLTWPTQKKCLRIVNKYLEKRKK